MADVSCEVQLRRASLDKSSMEAQFGIAVDTLWIKSWRATSPSFIQHQITKGKETGWVLGIALRWFEFCLT
jgi:hypothetical protein